MVAGEGDFLYLGHSNSYLRGNYEQTVLCPCWDNFIDILSDLDYKEKRNFMLEIQLSVLSLKLKICRKGRARGSVPKLIRK